MPETSPVSPAAEVLDASQEMTLVPNHAPSFLRGATVVDDTPLWAAWAAAQHNWLESKRRKSGSENTVRAYELAVKQFFQWAGVAPWNVHAGHAQEWAVFLSTAGQETTDPETGITTRAPLAETTVALKLASLSSFYDHVQRRYTYPTPDGPRTLWPADRANPFTVVERPKISMFGRAKYPTTAELKAILSEINQDCRTGKRDFALLYTIATTCRRFSEVANLKWGDIQELNDGNYAFRYRYKGGDIRTAVLDPIAYQAIVNYLVADDRYPEDMQDDDYVFIPLDHTIIQRLRPDDELEPNKPISNHQANSILKKYARRVGVDERKAHIHGLRHAGARLRVEQMEARNGGVDYMQLKDLLGHSSLDMTRIYSQRVCETPKDPGGSAAAEALMPKGPRRRRRTPPATQEKLL